MSDSCDCTTSQSVFRRPLFTSHYPLSITHCPLSTAHCPMATRIIIVVCNSICWIRWCCKHGNQFDNHTQIENTWLGQFVVSRKRENNVASPSLRSIHYISFLCLLKLNNLSSEAPLLVFLRTQSVKCAPNKFKLTRKLDTDHAICYPHPSFLRAVAISAANKLPKLQTKQLQIPFVQFWKQRTSETCGTQQSLCWIWCLINRLVLSQKISLRGPSASYSHLQKVVGYRKRKRLKSQIDNNVILDKTKKTIANYDYDKTPDLSGEKRNRQQLVQCIWTSILRSCICVRKKPFPVP